MSGPSREKGAQRAVQVTAQPVLLWTDMSLLGHDPMDDMHQEFVHLVAALQTSPDRELSKGLDEVLRHLKRHFGEEEAWMQESDYPATDCHVAEHAAVMASGNAVRQALDRGDVLLCRRFADELAGWFPGHANYLDAPLAHWLSKKRFGARPLVFRRNAVETAA